MGMRHEEAARGHPRPPSQYGRHLYRRPYRVLTLFYRPGLRGRRGNTPPPPAAPDDRYGNRDGPCPARRSVACPPSPCSRRRPWHPGLPAGLTCSGYHAVDHGELHRRCAAPASNTHSYPHRPFAGAPTGTLCVLRAAVRVHAAGAVSERNSRPQWQGLQGRCRTRAVRGELAFDNKEDLPTHRLPRRSPRQRLLTSRVVLLRHHVSAGPNSRSCEPCATAGAFACLPSPTTVHDLSW